MKVYFINEAAKLPFKARENDAGYDLFSSVDVALEPNKVSKLPIGIFIENNNPETYMQIHSRSSLAKNGIFAVGGVIDASYRGEIAVLLHNCTNENYFIHKGDKIAQIIIHKIVNNEVFELSETINETDRGSKGFGSSGF